MLFLQTLWRMWSACRCIRATVCCWQSMLSNLIMPGKFHHIDIQRMKTSIPTIGIEEPDTVEGGLRPHAKSSSGHLRYCRETSHISKTVDKTLDVVNYYSLSSIFLRQENLFQNQLKTLICDTKKCIPLITSRFYDFVGLSHIYQDWFSLCSWM